MHRGLLFELGLIQIFLISPERFSSYLHTTSCLQPRHGYFLGEATAAILDHEFHISSLKMEDSDIMAEGVSFPNYLMEHTFCSALPFLELLFVKIHINVFKAMKSVLCY